MSHQEFRICKVGARNVTPLQGYRWSFKPNGTGNGYRERRDALKQAGDALATVRSAREGNFELYEYRDGRKLGAVELEPTAEAPSC